MANNSDRIPFDIELPPEKRSDYKPPVVEVERPLDDMRAAGFNDKEISDWATGQRSTMKEAGFNDNEIDGYLTGGVNTPEHPPKAFVERLQNANAYDRVTNSVYQGMKEGYGGEEPLGLSLDTADQLAKAGLFNEIGSEPFSSDKTLAQNAMGGLRLFNEALVRPAAQAWDFVGRLFNSANEGFAAGGGQVVAEATGNEAQGERAKRDFRIMGQMAAIADGANFSRVEPHPITGKMDDVPIGGLPKSEDFAHAAKDIGGDAAPRATQEKLLRLYEEKGVHPAEVAHDALTDPTVKQSLLSSHADDLPPRYGPEKTEAPVEAPKGQETASSIFDDVSTRLKDAGMSPEEAAANAEVMTARYRARAARLGDDVDPLDLYRSENIEIRKNNSAAVDGVDVEFSDAFHRELFDVGAKGEVTPQAERLFERMRDFIEPDGVAIEKLDNAKDFVEYAKGFADDVRGDAASARARGAKSATIPEAMISPEAVSEWRKTMAQPQQMPPPIQSSIPNGVQTFKPADLTVDAKRFQFKEGGDEAGVTERLKGVKQWDPIKAGMVLVWEDKAGKRFIVDGHQRHGLAQRLADEGQQPQILSRVLKEGDGVTDAEARTVAALKNIAEGTGTAVDAAKVLREHPERAGELPPRSELYRQAQGLVNLSDDAFRMVINDVVPPKYGAIVGRLVPEDAQMQSGLLNLLAKTEPANTVQAEAIVRQGIEAGFAKAEKGAQSGLFGEEDVAESLYIERAKVLDKALKTITQDKKIFSVLTKEQNSIEAAGNKLAADVNEKRKAADAQAIQLLQTLANRKGPISDALNAAAGQARADGKFGKAVSTFVDDIRGLIERDEFAGIADGGKRSAANVADENAAGLGVATQLENPAAVDRASSEALSLFQAAREDSKQLEIAGAQKITDGELAQRKADSPLKAKKPQNLAMDEGLFSDSRNQKELFQAGPRGKITLEQNRAVIELFQSADESTFMHEASHLWLDELIRDATGKRSTEALKGDLDKTLKWLGVEKVDDIGVAQHEKWAKGFEKYLATGKAPSSALERAFESFKTWLTDIYDSLTGNGVQLPDDIRGVMDRLLATDDEIKGTVEMAKRKILDRIDVGGRDRREPFDFDRLYTMAVDDLHPLNQATQAMGGSKLASENPYKIARLARGAMGKSEQMLQRSTFEFDTLKNNGESLRAVLEPVKRDMNGLRAYADSRRAIELEGRGIKTGFDMEAAHTVVNDKVMRAKFEPVFQRLIAYQDRLVQYLHDSGIIDEKAWTAMREANKNYVPFYALMDDTVGQGGLFAGMNVKNPIKKIFGSERKKIDPIEGIIKNTIVYTKMAEDNRAGLAFKKMADESGLADQFYEKVKTPIVSTTVQADEMAKFLKKNGIEDAPDSLLTVFRAKHSPPARDEIAVFEGGKRQILRLDPEFAAAFKALDAEDVNMFVKALAIPARGLRAGATLTFEFMGRNLIRDFFTSTTTSKGVFTPFDTVKGLMSYLKKDKDFDAWEKAGGANSSMISVDRRYLQENLRKLTQDSGLMSRAFNVILPPGAADAATKAFGIPLHPIDTLRALSETFENATRLAEFKKNQRMGEAEGLSYKENTMRSGFASREVTLDFARAGSKSRAWNMIDAFFNASIQGTDRIVRAFRERPVATSAKIFGGITLPSVLLWAANHDDPRYKEIPQWQKDLFWIYMTDKWENVSDAQAAAMPPYLVRRSADGHMQANNGHIYRIPKPFEVGVLFGSGPERMLDALYDHNPEAFKGFASTIYGALVPNLVPTAVQPIVDQYSNKSMFTGRNLVPQSLEGQLPEYQYTPYTTELAKKIGSLIAAFPGMREASLDGAGFGSGAATAVTSPILIENYIRAWSGGLGQYALGIADKSLREAGVLPDPVVPTSTLADIPVIKGFVIRYPTATTQSIQDFYDGYEKNKKFYDTWMSKAQEGDEAAMQHIQDVGGPRIFVQLDSIKKTLSEHSVLINDIYKDPAMSADEKRQLIDSLYYSMIEIGKSGKEMLQQIDAETK